MGVAAKFPAHDQSRRSLIGKVHVAKKELCLDDDTYRGAIALAAKGKTSAADCTEAELVAVLDHFKLRGFAPKPRSGARRKAADHPSARKARALWISLYQLGVVRNKSESALETFAAGQLDCEAMQWMVQSDCYKLIEALKNMATRNGWAQRGPSGEALTVPQLQLGLCRAILAKLKDAGTMASTQTVDTAAFQLTGMMPGRVDYGRLAGVLGDKLRQAGK